MFDNSEQHKATVAGTYKGNGADVVNESVRKVQEVRFDSDVILSGGFNLNKNINMACEMANLLFFNNDDTISQQTESTEGIAYGIINSSPILPHNSGQMFDITSFKHFLIHSILYIYANSSPRYRRCSCIA